MKVDAVARAFPWLGDQVTILLGYTNVGSTFVYGYLDDKSLAEKGVMMADGSTYFLTPPFYYPSSSMKNASRCFASLSTSKVTERQGGGLCGGRWRCGASSLQSPSAICSEYRPD